MKSTIRVFGHYGIRGDPGGRRDGWPGWWSRVAAAVLMLAGAVFGIGGAVVLGSSRTIFPEPQPRARLVRTGVYAVVRHPLYTSVFLRSSPVASNQTIIPNSHHLCNWSAPAP